jgi:hypothetical protein
MYCLFAEDALSVATWIGLGIPRSKNTSEHPTLVAKARALAPFAEFEISRSRSRGVDDVTDCAPPCHMREYNKVP